MPIRGRGGWGIDMDSGGGYEWDEEYGVGRGNWGGIAKRRKRKMGGQRKEKIPIVVEWGEKGGAAAHAYRWLPTAPSAS